MTKPVHTHRWISATFMIALLSMFVGLASSFETGNAISLTGDLPGSAAFDATSGKQTLLPRHGHDHRPRATAPTPDGDLPGILPAVAGAVPAPAIVLRGDASLSRAELPRPLDLRASKPRAPPLHT